MEKGKEFKFNAHGKLKSMRLTEDEKRELLFALWEETDAKEEKPAELVTADQYIEEAEALRVEGDGIIGVTSGYKSVDTFTRGFGKGDIIIVFADTHIGKSQFTQNICYRNAISGTKVMLVGLEMTNAQNNTRFMDIADARKEDYSALKNIVYPISNDIKLPAIEADIKQAVIDGVKLVVIDGLQGLTRSVDNRTNETSMISAELKRMALTYEVPIILLCHINRSGSESVPPTLRELKDSSAIGQDADICLALWRNMDPRMGALNELHVINRKNRNRGHVGEATVLFNRGTHNLVDPLDGREKDVRQVLNLLGGEEV